MSHLYNDLKYKKITFLTAKNRTLPFKFSLQITTVWLDNKIFNHFARAFLVGMTKFNDRWSVSFYLGTNAIIPVLPFRSEINGIFSKQISYKIVDISQVSKIQSKVMKTQFCSSPDKWERGWGVNWLATDLWPFEETISILMFSIRLQPLSKKIHPLKFYQANYLRISYRKGYFQTLRRKMPCLL